MGWEESLEVWVEALAGEAPVPAGGALALATLAGAAALAAKAALLAGHGPAAWEARAALLLAEALRDGPLYLAAARGGPAEARASLEATLEALEVAVGTLEDLGPLFEAVPRVVAADVAAAERMARAGAETLSVNLAANLSAWADRSPQLGGCAARWEALRARLAAA